MKFLTAFFLVLITYQTHSEQSTSVYDVECASLTTCGIFNPLANAKVPAEWTFDVEHAENVNKFESNQLLHLKFIPDEIFSKYPKLTIFKLVDAGIETLPDHHFINSKHLKKLILNSNAIQIIKSNAFAHLQDIMSIEIMHNNITTIEPDAFHQLTNLENLYLTGNKLKHLTATAITGATKLKFVELNENALETIDDGALDLPSLEGVNLRRNYLKSIPKDFCGKSPKLRYVHLSVNQLPAIDMEFDSCQNLKIIYLDNNRIESINLTSLANLENLRILQLGYNCIKFPSTPGNVTNSKSILETLPMEFNHFTTPDLFKHIAMFKNIERITLRGNEFTSFNDPAEIIQLLPKLKHIYFSDSPEIRKWIADNAGIFRENNIVIMVN